MARRDYIITATKDGDQHTEYIRARSAQEAVYKAEDMGLTEVKLLTSETAARMPMTAGQRAVNRDSMPAWLAARLFRAGPLEAYFLTIVAVYRRLWFFPALAAAIVIIHLALGHPPGWVEAVAILIAAIPFGLVAVTNLVPDSNPLDDAVLAADWDRILEITRKGMQRADGNDAATMELTRWRAKALAAKGGLEQAESLITGLKSLPTLGEPLRLVILASVYESARDFQRAARAYEDALHVDPDFGDAWLFLAVTLAARLHDPAGARSALDQARSLPISEPARPVVDLCLGAIALEEKEPAAALDHFQRARERFEHFPAGASRTLTLAGLDAACALAHAALNDRDQAQRHLDRARPLLNGHDPELIERCERAIKRQLPAPDTPPPTRA